MRGKRRARAQNITRPCNFFLFIPRPGICKAFSILQVVRLVSYALWRAREVLWCRDGSAIDAGDNCLGAGHLRGGYRGRRDGTGMWYDVAVDFAV